MKEEIKHWNLIIGTENEMFSLPVGMKTGRGIRPRRNLSKTFILSRFPLLT